MINTRVINGYDWWGAIVKEEFMDGSGGGSGSCVDGAVECAGEGLREVVDVCLTCGCMSWEVGDV